MSESAGNTQGEHGQNQNRIQAPQALVRVAVPVREAERRELEALIRERLGRIVDCEFAVDPEILGGVWVRVGDTVLDGSVRGRMEELRHHLRTQCRFIIANRLHSSGRPPSTE